MFDWIERALRWLAQMWDGLDDDTKRMIIEAIVAAMEEVFRSYYRDQQGG